MDDVSTAIRDAIVREALGKSGAAAEAAKALEKAMASCLRTQCQREIGKCKANNGPCKLQRIRLEARRDCRPMKREIMEAHTATCERNAKKMFDLNKGEIPEEHHGSVFEELLNKCRHNAAEKDPKYQACFHGALLRTMGACAAENCMEGASACIKDKCKLGI